MSKHLLCLVLSGACVVVCGAQTADMAFVRVEPGSFVMGDGAGGDWDERPARTVWISRAFEMAVTEVTNAQYEQFDPGHRALRGAVHGFSTEDGDAAVFVSWHDAVRFCAWLSERDGAHYRLPTEAEWEYACRAGTATAYWTGDAFPEEHGKAQQDGPAPRPVSLRVAQCPANPWGLHDMHGNVEEWCLDWHAPYAPGEQTDPIGPAGGDFKVTRGGSHNTDPFYLRSANRSATLPEDRHWLIGFRVVRAAPPDGAPAPDPAHQRWARGVAQDRHAWDGGPDPAVPYFDGPIPFVKIPQDADGPLFAQHNHCPAVTACPNGDLLAIWYTTRTEPGRELGIAAARLRRGAAEWEEAAPFWDAADRNDHASELLWDGGDTLYHFNGLGAASTWAALALVLRTSTDNGATWSPARIVSPDHGLRNMPIANGFIARGGAMVLPCDAVTGGAGGSVVHVSEDGGVTWRDTSGGRPQPPFAAGAAGPYIAGIHAGVVDLRDGRLLAFGRGDNLDGRMPMSVSADMGRTWTYAPSPFPPIGGGQRLTLRRLREGPLMFTSFGADIPVKGPGGESLEGSGLFAALSYDDGETWPVRRLVTDGLPDREMDGGGNTGPFVLGPASAEPRGYCTVEQTPDGVIHLLSSRLHYRFNLAWLESR